jgi:hypothetical protein
MRHGSQYDWRVSSLRRRYPDPSLELDLASYLRGRLEEALQTLLVARQKERSSTLLLYPMLSPISD